MFRLLPIGLVALASPLCSVALAVEAPGRSDGASVLVLPFQSPGGTGQWMGNAVQQDLLTDLSQGTTVRVTAPAELPAAVDSTAAQEIARKSGASIVVFGQVQQAGGEVRLTGQVLDATTGATLGNLKATGPSSDLFHLEDALSGQVLAAVPKTMLSPKVLQAQQQQPPAGQQTGQTIPAASAASAPTLVGTPTYAQAQPDAYQYAPASTYSEYQPAATYTYNYFSTAPDYGYAYASPYIVPAYTYGCPEIDLYPFCGSFGFVGGFFFGDSFHHDGHRGFEGNHDFDGHRGFEGHSGFHGQAGGHGGSRGGAFVGGSSAGHLNGTRGSRFANGGSRSVAAGSGYSRARPSYSYAGSSRSLAPAFHSSSSFGGSHSSFGGSHGGGFHSGGFGRAGGFHGGGGGHGGGGHR